MKEGVATKQFDIEICLVLLYDIQFYAALKTLPLRLSVDVREFAVGVKNCIPVSGKVTYEGLSKQYTISVEQWNEITSVPLDDVEQAKRDLMTRILKRYFLERLDQFGYSLDRHLNTPMAGLVAELGTLHTLGREVVSGLDRVGLGLSIQSLIDEVLLNHTDVSGYTTGDEALDKHGIRFDEGIITTIFAGTGVGKTRYTIYLAHLLSKNNHNLLYINLEMPKSKFIKLLLLRELSYQEFSVPDTKRGDGYEDDVDSTVLHDFILQHKDRLRLDGMQVENPDILNLAGLEAMVRQFVMRGDHAGKNKVVVIDLVGMIKGYGYTPESISAATDRLHEIAKQYNVHIIQLVQAKRDIENNSKERGRVRDMAAVGGIGSIKGSGSPAERSRYILGIARMEVRDDIWQSRILPALSRVDIQNTGGYRDMLLVSVVKNTFSGSTGKGFVYFANMWLSSFFPVVTDNGKCMSSFDCIRDC